MLRDADVPTILERAKRAADRYLRDAHPEIAWAAPDDDELVPLLKLVAGAYERSQHQAPDAEEAAHLLAALLIQQAIAGPDGIPPAAPAPGA